jgi:DNA-binding LacI/PurR family transcriptional regulator
VVWGAKMPNQHYVSIGSNNIRGGFLAVEHLIKQNCNRIAFFGNVDLPEVAQRYEGYLLAHKQYALSVDTLLCIPAPFSTETVSSDIEKLIKDSISFDGLFGCSDLIAIRAISTLQKLGISVPEEVAIVGYDDIMLATYYHPAVSTIKQSIEAGAHALVQAIFKIIENKKVNSEQLEVTFVSRESSMHVN